MVDNGVFITPQEELTEEINLRLFDLQRHKRIEEEITNLIQGRTK